MTAPRPPHKKPVPARTGLILALLGVLLLALGLAACLPSGTPSGPTPEPTFADALWYSDSERLARPTLSSPDDPTQDDLGSLVYWSVCMACHGDRGQGLTEEWRTTFGEDMNCWQSKCHAANYPPGGFEIPRDRLAPPLVGPGALARFQTAQELYEYILETMPWWKPGSLSPERAWAVTSHLLEMNATLPEGILLDETAASAISVHRRVAVGTTSQAGIYIFIGVLTLAAALLGLRLKFRPGTAPPAAQTDPEPGAPAVRRPNFFLHLHPPAIPARQAAWSYTLGLGGLAVFLSLVLLVTGILEMFYYVPQTDQATISIQRIAHLVPFGGLIRNLHFWGAQALVVVLCLHLLRIVLTRAYRKPRRFNYLLGLFLFLLALGLDFTGYTLRWDNGISWALVVGTNLLKTVPGIGEGLYRFVIGGAQPGAATLLRFYSWHIFGLTLLMGIAVAWHLFRIRRDGGIAAPPAVLGDGRETITRSELLRRELLLMTAAGIVLLLVSSVLPAPVTAPLGDTAVDLSTARAPWFFLWIQQLLKYGDPFLLGVLVPLVVLLLLALIPYLNPKPADSELGRWFPRGGRPVQILIGVLTLVLLALTVLALLPS
jgi:quinol-cytochrome oxidoreductase complex cytochrome b subunit